MSHIISVEKQEGKGARLNVIRFFLPSADGAEKPAIVVLKTSSPLVLPPRSCGTRALLEDALKRFGIRPQVIMEVDDVGTIVSK